MRKRLLSVPIFLLFTFSFLAILNFNTIGVFAAVYPAVYIEPATTVDSTLPPGSLYTISVKTNYTGDDINSWQFTLSYNASVLKMGIDGLSYTDVWTGTGTKKSFEATGKLIVPDSEDVYVNKTLMTKNVNYTIDYQTGMITFTTAPAKGVEVKATYLYCLINGDLITTAINPNAMFNPGNYDNVAGKLSLTGAFFFFIFPPGPMTSGPGTLANVTFTVVGIGESSITLGPETKLIGLEAPDYKDPYSIVDGEIMPENLGHGYFNNIPPPPVHDVAVTSLDAPTKATIGDLVSINVIVANEGDFTESFTVTVYYGSSILETKDVINLASGDEITLTLNWNTTGVPSGNYTIKAVASTVTGETDTADNFKTTTIEIKPFVFHVPELDFNIIIDSNSTLSNFEFRKDDKELRFTVSGPTGTTGYCNVAIPMDKMTGNPWTILVGGEMANVFQSDNGTHTFLYFTYTHSLKTVIIRGTWVVPEFPTPMLLLLVLAILAASAIALNRKTGINH